MINEYCLSLIKNGSKFIKESDQILENIISHLSNYITLDSPAI